MAASQSPAGTSTDFCLEIDDRTDEERERDKRSATRRGLGVEGPAAPMDTNYHEEMDPATPKVMVNLGAIHELMGIPEPCLEERNMKRFDRQRLFEAVASRDVMLLEGLHQYLYQNLKKLSNAEYASGGKNALMKALLNLQDGRNNTVEYLLEISERMEDVIKFVNAEYTNAYYKGHTSLHIAIERRSLHYVKLLVSKGANRADVQAEDSHGNTVLHTLVLVADNSPENTEFVTAMYDHILTAAARVHPKLRLEDAVNKCGFTPIKLAAKTGKIRLFEHILHREFQDGPTKHLSRKFTEWVYGPVHSSLYDLADLDSCQDQVGAKSVLEILVYGTDIPNRHKMLQIEPLSKLLDDKWSRFARYIFTVYFIVYLIYLFLADMRRKRPKLSTLLIDGYFELLFLLQALCLLTSAGLYWAGRQQYLGFLVVSLALSWVNLLYFFRGNKHMGIYSVMIQKMILGDIMRFLFVYLVFLLGFSADASNATATRTFFEPLKGDEGCTAPTYRDFSYTMLELFKFTIGMGDLEYTEQYEYKAVFYVLLISYIILTYVLLFNMLIALMSRTVEQITLESASIWMLQKDLGSFSTGEDIRWCFRVEEVNWTKWRGDVGIIHEDPGSREQASHHASNGASETEP
ncbi:hypothetical protein CRUP_001285 [Coryphaenoides rupestris]|nr:hypothetical protein CRUP_001285 [Coryphaenoides rupestris]